MTKLEKLKKELAEIEEKIDKNIGIMLEIHKEGVDPVTRCWNETEYYRASDDNYFLCKKRDELERRIEQIRTAKERKYIRRMLA